MKKLHRGRLLLSTCLTGIALASASGAQAQDTDPNWQPRTEVDARAADGSSQVSFELFAPVAQNDSSLMFVSGRIGYDERFDRNGSVTIGGRGKIGEDFAIGVNAGVDFYKSDISKRDQTAVSFGLEGFTSVFDVRLNYRLPVTNRRTIGYLDPNASPVGALLVENNRLIERKSGWRLEDVPLGGANAEIGATVPLGKSLSIRASAAGFDYRDDAASKAYRGARGALELGVEDPLGTGGRFLIGAELQNDNRWGTQARGTIRLSIPLGRGSRDRSAGNSGLDRQMGDRIRRDYVTPSSTRYTDLTSNSFAIDARTGNEFGGIYYVNGSAAAAGAGSSASPTTLADAVTRAGANGVVVAMGNAGNITTGGVTLATNQYLVGGASSVNVRHSNGTVSAFSFGGTNGTIVGGNAGGAAVTLGQGSVVRDITIRGAGSGILANGVGGFALERVVIENTGGAGLTLTNTTGAVVVDGITIRGGAGAGLVVNGGSNVTLRNSLIGGGAGAIDINDAGGNLTASLSNLTLSATGGNVLDIDGSGAGTVTVAGLSGIFIAGGNGETGGFAARNVTFDSSTAAGIQAVNAGTMQVGTTTARVNGAGVSLTEVDGALSFGSLNIANNAGTGLTVNNTKTGTFTLTSAGGAVDTTAGTALNLDPLLINLTFASVRSVGATGAGIILDNVQGAGTGGNALNIGTLTITDSGQQGLFITGGSTGVVTIANGSITNSGGASVQLGEAGVAGSGGTIGLNVGATITDAGAGPLASIFNAGGAIRFTGAISGAGPITIDGTAAGSSIFFAGNTTISGSAATALSINNVAGSVGFTGALTITNPAGGGIAIGNSAAGSSVSFTGVTTITGAASSALSLNNLAGSTAFSGALSIVNPAGAGIVIGAVPGGVTFGDVDITGLGAGTGLNLTGTSGNVTFGTLDITGTGAAGSTGIDLTNAANAGSVTIINPSVIQGVDIGANLTNAHITGSFRYGDGNAADGLESRITANTVIAVLGLNATQGTYDFADVQLDGDTNNITGGSFTTYYVLAGATGTGTATDPGSIAGAAASGAQYIVLLNDPNGGRDVIDTAGLTGGALSLTTGQSLVSFRNTDFFAVTGATVPANLIVSNLGPTGIVNTFAGSGAAILTSSLGTSTVNLANDTRIDGVVINNDALGTGIFGSGVSNVIIRNSTISGTGGAISIVDGGAAASVTLTNLNLSASGGRALSLNGAGAGTLNVSGTGISIAATGAASAVGLTDVTVGTLDIDSVTTQFPSSNAVMFNQVAGGTVNVGSVTTFGTTAPTGTALAVVNSSATVNIGAVDITNTAGSAVTILNNSGNVTLGPVSVFNSAGSVAAVNISGNTGNVTLGPVLVDSGAADGVRLNANGGTVSLGQLTVRNVAGAGLRVAGATGATTIAGATIGAANNGIVVTNVSGALSIGSTAITNSSGSGIQISGVTGSASFTGTTTISGGNGIVLGAGSTGAIRFGDTDIAGLGANKTGVDARAASGTISFATLDISGTSTSGTRGIDMRGATFAGSITVADSSAITGVGIGVDLTNAAITGNFRFGDGSNTDADGAASTINAITPITVGGINQTVGTYDFADVNLTGDTTGLVTNPISLFFVEQGRTGAGTKTDPGSLAAALASSASVIVLLNNPTGGNDTLDVAGLGTFALDANQRLIGFLNGDSQNVGGGTPTNMILYGLAQGIVTNPYAGSGAGLLTNTGGGATVTLANGSSIDGLRIGGTGIGVSGIGVSNVSITNSIISGGLGAIMLRDGGAAASATLTNLALSGTGGTVLNLLGTNGGSLRLRGSGISIAATGNARGLMMNSVTLGANLGFGAVSTLTSAGAGVALNNIGGPGGLSFSGINVGGTSAGAGISLGGNTAAINLGTVAVANTAGNGVEVLANTGNVTLGTFAISGATTTGLRVEGMQGAFTALGGSITGGTTGLSLTDIDGSVTFTGGVTIANPGSTGISLGLGSAGAISFGDVDITGLGANTTGLNARNASGNVTFGTLDITGASATGTRGIDLTGATFGGNLVVSGSSSITGVGTGVDLTNAAITGSFRFGDGSNTDANGAGSTINATTPLIAAGLNGTTGAYNFADVNLTGDTSSLATSARVYWALAGSSGAGTRVDPGSLAGAAASGADIIILLNNPAGGNDTLDVAGLGTFALAANQRLLGFLNGDSQAVSGGMPANLVLYNVVTGSVTNPFAGSGAALLTNTSANPTVTLANGATIDGLRIGGAGIGVSGIGVSLVSISNSIISGDMGAILLRDGGVAASAALTNLTLSGAGGTVLDLLGTSGGSLSLRGSGISIAATGNARGLAMDSVTLGANLGFTSVSTLTSAGAGVALNNVGGPGSLNFASINVGGTASQSGVRVTGNAAGINLGNVTVANTAGHGIEITGNTGNMTLGTFSISDTGSTGLLVSGVSGNFMAAGGTITNSGTTGIAIADIDGSVTFTGGVTITNPGSTGITLGLGSTGTTLFADVDIVGLTAGKTGLDARTASGNTFFGTLDITGASAIGTRGIDLTGAAFGGNVIVSRSSTITGVGTGVDLTNAAITGSFQFGDGSNTDANGAGSTINATTPLVVTGLNSAVGTYNFADVNLIGDTSSLATSASVYWVLAGASGTGTRGDPGSLAGAAASGADIIILVNNPAGGNDLLDVNDPTHGTGGAFTLMTGQQLRGFLNGDTIALPGGAPANVVLYNVATGSVTNPFAGSGAPTLTSSVGGTDTVRVTGNNLIDGVRITSAGTGVYGSAAANITIRNSIISGVDSAIELLSGGGAATAALSNLVLTSTGASIPLALYANGGGSMTVTQLSNITINQGVGSQGAYLIGATFDADLATAGDQAVDASMTIGSAGNRLNGNAVNLTNALGALNFTSLSIYNQNGNGILASGAGLALTSTAGTIDTLNGTAISLTGTQADLVLDNVVHAGTGTGIAISGLTGIGTGGRALTVANLQVTGGTNGISFTGNNNGTVSFGAASSISGTSGSAIAIASGTGTLGFTYNGSVTQSSNAALLDVAGHSGSIIFGGSSNLDATAGTGLQFSNADGTYLFAGLTTLHGGNAGIDILAGSAGNFTFGTGTLIASPSGSAITIDSSTANVTLYGSISHGAAGTAAVNVVNHSVGTIDFSGAGFLITGGNGLAFDNADGIYKFDSASLTGGAAITISNGSAGDFTFGANTSVTNSAAAAISIADSTASLSYSGNVAQANNAALLSILNHSGGAISFLGGTLSATNGTGLQFDNADGTYAFNGTTTLNGGDAGIDILNGSAGSFSFAAGTTITSPTGAAISISNSTASLSYSGNVAQANNAALLSVLNHSGGTIDFLNGTLGATNGTGLRFSNADGTYNFNGTTALNGGSAGISILTNSAGSFTFGANTTITNPFGPAFAISNSTASVTYRGTLNQSDATSLALSVSTHSTGTLDFSGATVNATGGHGLTFNDADGAYNFGNAALSGGASLRIINGSAGVFTFGNVDITGLMANTTAVDLTGATGNVTFATLDIAAASAIGTRGIDMTGSTTAGNVIVSGSSSMTGLRIGVDLTNAAITGNFRYGDGSNTDANGAASSISAITPLVIGGLNGGTGNYNFADVNMVGDTTNLSVSAYFVLEGATGSGTRSDPGSLAGAEAANATYIVLLNNPTGGVDILDATLGAGGSFDLDGGQILYSFRDTDSFTVGGGAPANIVLYNVQTGVISNPFAGSGAPILTASGANATLTLGGANIIDGVIIANSGTGAGILGNGAGGTLTIRNSTISGGAAGALRIYDNAANVVLGLSNLTLAANGGNILNLDGSGAGTFTLTQLANLNVTHTTETGGFVFSDLTFDSDTVTAGVQAVNAGALTLGTTGARITGTGLSLTNVTGTLNFTNLNIANNGGTGLIVANSKVNNFTLGTTGGAIDTTNGTAINLDPLSINMVLNSVSATGGAYGILLDQVLGSFTVTGAVNVTGATNTAIAVRDNTALGVQFQGAVAINNTAGAGVSLTNNTGSTVDFTGGLGIVTTGGTGFATSGGGTISVTGSGNTITAGSGDGLALNGITVATAGVTFDQITAASALGAGLSAVNVNLAGALNIGGLNLDAVNTAVVFDNLTGTGGVNLTGTLDIDSGIGFAFSGALGTINIANTAGSSLTIDGGQQGMHFGAVTGGTVNVANGAGSAAINGSISEAINFNGDTGGTLNYGGTINVTQGRVLNAANSLANVTLSGAITSTTAGTAFDFANADGNYTISGNVSHTGGAGVAINAASAGGITFSGASKSFNTGANTAVSMAGTGALSFTAGGLGITTTTGRGFSASGGGTVLVNGGSNTITSGNATALSLNGVTLAAGGVAFQSISATPTAATAVVASALNLGGTLAIHGLTVSGGGTAASFSNLAGSASVVLDGTIDIDGGIGLEFSGALGTINIANGAGSTLTIDGATTAIRFNGVTSGDVNIGLSGGSASIGATTSSTTAAIALTGGTGGLLTYGGTVRATAGAALSVANSSSLASLSGAITSTSANPLFDFANADGTYVVTGSVSHNGGAGIVVDAASGGNITFSGASKAFSAGTSTAVSMAGTGTLSLTGGGLDIDTTTGTGLSASGGTVAITGANNRIDTTTGQILSLSGATAGSGGINFASLTATGSVANNGILLNNLTGGAFNGGTVNIGGTSVPAGDGIKVIGGTAAITFGTTTIGMAASNAIELLNSGSAVTFGTLNLAGAGSSTVVIAGSTGAVAMGTGSVTATGAANYAVEITGGTGVVDIFAALAGTNMVRIVDHETGNITFVGDMSSTVSGISITNSNSGVISFSGTSLALGGTGPGVFLDGNAGGTIDFRISAGGNGLDIVTTGTGFTATNGGTILLRGSGNSISTTGTGTALNLQDVILGLGGINFASVSANGAATGIALNGVSSTGAALALGTVNLQGITSRGIDISGNNPAGLSINDLDIALNSNSAVAFDLNGATLSTPIMIGDFDVTNAGGAGTSIGVDLGGTTGGAGIVLGGLMGASSTITGVGTGIYLNASTNALLTYGDGEAAIDVASAISAGVAIDASNAPTVGTYDFRDVTFLGSPGTGFGLNKIWFVDADGATGGGNGSGSDGNNPMTIAAAMAVAGVQDIIVLINNGSMISTGASSLLLANGAQVRGFGDGIGGGSGSGSAPVSLTITVPSTILLSGGTTINIADPTGLGAARLTSNAGVGSVITLGSTGNRLSGFILDGASGVARGIYSSAGTTSAQLDQLTIRNFVGIGGIELSSAANSTIDRIAFSNNLTDMVVNGGTGSAFSNLTSTGASGNSLFFGSVAGLTLTNINIAGASGAGLYFNGSTGTITATNVDVASTSGPAIYVTGGAANFNFDATSSITQASNAAALGVAGGHNGTLTYAGTIGATNGTGLQFDNADGTYSFTGTVTLNGGDAGIDILNGSGGSFTFGTGTTITSPTGTAVNVAGSTAGVTYSGNITQANNAALVSVLNHSGGTIAFQTGTIGATNGTGLQFDNADGTYNFTGTTTLNGGDAGVDILNGSAGSFTFGTGTTITSPSGTAFNVSGSTAGVTYSGNITQANNAALVNVLNHSIGTITFQTGTLSATNGTGLQFNNADGAYNFNGTTTLNGGDAGVDIVNGSVGTFGFGTGTSITHAAAGDAFVMSGSNAAMLFSGSIDDSNGHAVNIDGHNAGTLQFDGTITANGANATGISLTNNAGGTITFNGQVALTTGANNALTLTGNAGSTIAFNAGGNGLDIVTTSGTGLLISGGGTINVLGMNNSIATGSGTLLDIANATAAATALNLNFATAANSSGANGILVSRTAGTLTGSVTIASGAITASTRAVDLDGDALNFTYGGNIFTTGTTGRSVEVTNRTANTASFTGNITDNALGINVSNNTGGTVSFNGPSIALTTVANATALTLASNTGATILFGPVGGGNGLDIVASGTGTGISFSGGGTLSIFGTGNTVQSATGQILNLVNGNVGAAGLNFDSLTSTGTVAGTAINISNLDGGTLNGGTVNIAGTSGAGSDGIFYGGGSTSNVNFGAVTITGTTDEGIEVNGAGNGTFTANSVTIDNTGGNGVEINGSTNTVTLAGGAIGATNDPTGFGVYVLNGTGGINIAASVTKTTVGNVIFVDNHETGNVNFSGYISGTGGVNNGIVVQNVNSGTVSFLGNVILSTGANTAVSLLNNTGGTISFPNGGLSITTASGTGFSATGGGNVDVQGTNSTITSGSGTALNIANTTIGANGVNFRSISTNGASSGIILNNTGASGGLRVVGTGAAGSGGTIQNSAGDGISLTNTQNVRLSYMNVTNNLGDGIGGSNINGFMIDNLLITGNGNDNGTDESGINISELTGTGSGGARPTLIFNTTISNNNEFEIQITNSTGTLTNFHVLNSTISSNGNAVNGNPTPGHGNLFNFLGTGTSAMGLTVTGSTFTGNWNPSTPPSVIVGSGVFIDSSGTSMTANISTSNFYNTNNGINVSTGPGSTTLTYSVIGNTITGSRSTAINDFQNGNAPFTRTVNGTIQNNIIGTNGVAMSGSQLGNGISISNEGSVNANYLVSGNTIQQVGVAGTSGSSAIAVNVGLVGQATFGGTTNVTITNNTIRDILNSRGIVVNNNQNTGSLPTIRLSMSSNQFLGTIAGQAGNGQYIRISDSGGGPFFVTQQAATASAIASELDDANGFNDTSKISIGTGTFTYGAAAPTLPPAVVPLP